MPRVNSAIGSCSPVCSSDISFRYSCWLCLSALRFVPTVSQVGRELSCAVLNSTLQHLPDLSTWYLETNLARPYSHRSTRMSRLMKR